jgi:hypothetical protein
MRGRSLVVACQWPEVVAVVAELATPVIVPLEVVGAVGLVGVGV